MVTRKLVISEEQLRRRIAELGAEISRDYAGKDLVMVGVLNGAFIFLADLARAVDVPLEIDFLRVASYGNAASSAGEVRFSKDVDRPMAGKHVLLVEDIVDTGITLAWLEEHCRNHRAASVRVCVLIDKPERRERTIKVDYCGFVVESGFLVGYGLDHAEQHRHYPAIYALDPDGLD